MNSDNKNIYGLCAYLTSLDISPEINSILKAAAENIMKSQNDKQQDITYTSKKSESLESLNLLTLKQCSEKINNVSYSSLRRAALNGKIPYTMIGESGHGKMLIKEQDLLKFFNN